MLPKIYLTAKVAESIKILEYKNDTYEWCAELWGNYILDEIVINELLLQKQYVSSTSVNHGVDVEDLSKFRHETQFYHYQRGKTRGKKLLGWIHSHVYHEIFLSETDVGQIQNYLREVRFIISIVTGKRSIRSSSNTKRSKHRQILVGMWISGLLQDKQYKEHKLSLGDEFFIEYGNLNQEDLDIIQQELTEDYENLCHKRGESQGNKLSKKYQ